MEATARRQERLRSGQYGRASSRRPSLRWAPSKCIHLQDSKGGVTWAFKCSDSAAIAVYWSEG
eukprot:97086-Prymnesium_polylepis.1